jgi:hypothetical protein
LDYPGAEQDRNRRRWLPSNEVTVAVSRRDLGARDGRRGTAWRLLWWCRPCRRTPASRSASSASRRAARAGPSPTPASPWAGTPLPTLRGPPYSFLASRWRRLRCDRRATPSAEPPTRPAARLERGVPACAGTRDRPVTARGP